MHGLEKNLVAPKDTLGMHWNVQRLGEAHYLEGMWLLVFGPLVVGFRFVCLGYWLLRSQAYVF